MIDCEASRDKQKDLIKLAKCSFPECRANALRASEDGRCFWHNTDKKITEKQTSTQSKGGKSGSPVVQPMDIQTLDDVWELLLSVMSHIRYSQSLVLRAEEMHRLEKSRRPLTVFRDEWRSELKLKRIAELSEAQRRHTQNWNEHVTELNESLKEIRRLRLLGAVAVNKHAPLPDALKAIVLE